MGETNAMFRAHEGWHSFSGGGDITSLASPLCIVACWTGPRGWISWQPESTPNFLCVGALLFCDKTCNKCWHSMHVIFSGKSCGTWYSRLAYLAADMHCYTYIKIALWPDYAGRTKCCPVSAYDKQLVRRISGRPPCYGSANRSCVNSLEAGRILGCGGDHK